MDKLEEANVLARRAVGFDKEGCIEASAYYYRASARLIKEALGYIEDSAVRETYLEKANQYSQRADFIQTPKEERQPEREDPSAVKLKKCKFLFGQALDADQAQESETALQLYLEAVDMALTIKSEIEDKVIQDKIARIAMQALSRAEEMKGINREETNLVPSVNTSYNTSQQSTTLARQGNIIRGGEIKRGGGGGYTEEEKKVLLATSKINKNSYVPFMEIDLNERFRYAIAFTDSDGELALSPKQKRHFARWARPDEFCSKPTLILNNRVDPFSIKQTIISDCSFVASLAVSALYERKTGNRLITAIIYPQNRNGEPIYNPFGKYMVKLHLNGVARKIIVDDRLPLGKSGELLCSFSTNRSELWVSILEKAYMKVMGGYDFPGSNSNIDLHALTGWIPERQAIRPKDPDWNKDALFNTLLERVHKGDVLVTVATGDLREDEAEKAGLVPTHAYALLDVRMVKGVKLMKLKNPWSHVRWRGNYSELDEAHWTEELKRALSYEPSDAATFDNGVFWIDYHSLVNFFDVFYLNWNPAIFTHTFSTHQEWGAGVGPVKDCYNIGENPQFRAEITAPGSGSLWLLLTRHITQIEDFSHNTEYITLLVYKNKGNRVYYPSDPGPYIDGVRINSPHYLTKIIVGPKDERVFTLVVSQYEKLHTIRYTLKAYSNLPFTLTPITDPYTIKKQVGGEWKGETAGGCRNHPETYNRNPSYQLVLEQRASLYIELKAARTVQIGFEISSTQHSFNASTSPYRSGFVMLEIKDIYGGCYTVVPSAYTPQMESQFILTLKATSPFRLNRIN